MSLLPESAVRRTSDEPIKTWAPWLLLFLVLATYANTLTAPFVFDDRPAIVDNPTIRSLIGSWQPPENGSSAVGRPLVNMSFAVNYAVGGLDVRGYHALNIALHGAVALLLFAVLRSTLVRTGVASAEARALAISAIWAVHPLLTESVSCVVQRNEVMAGWFYLAIFHGLIRSSESTGHAVHGWLAFAVLASLAGVLTKEMVATAPLLAWLYDRTFISGSFGTAWTKRKGFYVALLLTWIPLALLILSNRQRTGTVGFGLGISSWEYLLTQCQAIALYLKLSIWPHPLVIDYGVPVVRRWQDAASTGLPLLALLVLTARSLRKRSALGFLGAGFFIILAPSSSIVPLTTQTIAEHRMYLPLIAVISAIVLAWPHQRLSGRVSAVTAVVLVSGLAILTAARNDVYRDEFRLWRQTIAARPENPRGYSNLANAYVRTQEWAAAIAAYRQAIAVRPDFADAQSNLGNALSQVGQTQEALEHLQTAVSLKPEDPDIRYNLGNGYLVAGQNPTAIERLREAIRLRPVFPVAHQKLGSALMATQQPRQAAEEFALALQQQPSDVESLASLGNALLALGDRSGAAQRYSEALRLAPDQAGLHYNLANVLSQEGRWNEAILAYEKSLALEPSSVATEHNLALALLAIGRKEAARQHALAAQKLAPNDARVTRLLQQIGP